MRYDRETYERIESYLDGRLTPEENKVFEQLMAENESFAAEVDAYILANKAIEATAYNELRQEIRKGIQQYDRQMNGRWKLGLAILLGGLLVSGLLLILKPVPESSKTVIPGQDTLKQKEMTESADEDTVQSMSDDRNNPVAPLRSKPAQNQDLDKAGTDSLIMLKTDPDTIIHERKKSPELSVLPPDKRTETVIEVQPQPANVSAERVPDCAGFRTGLRPELRAACEGRADGEISFVQNRTNAQELYSIHRPGMKQSALYYTDLYSGDYTFVVTNQSGCQDTVLVYLPAKSCRKRDFVLNPDAGETWEVPVSDYDVFDLQIMDMSGQVVFNRIRERRFAWKGISDRGVVLPSGLYVYLIVLEDKTQLSGQITIIR